MKMFFPFGRKGITPTIAIILLLGLTVSSAGTAFYWLNLIDGQIQGEEQINVKEYGSLEGKIEIIAARYDGQANSLVMFLKNTGNTAVPVETASIVPTTLWVLKNTQENVICSTDWSGVENAPICKEGCVSSIASGELRRVILGNLGAGHLCNVQNQPSDSLLHYTIDFSGKAVADGGFVR